MTPERQFEVDAFKRGLAVLQQEESGCRDCLNASWRAEGLTLLRICAVHVYARKTLAFGR